jgi:hypothetical protein
MPVQVLLSVSPYCILHIAYAERHCLYHVDERARDSRRSCFPVSSARSRRLWFSRWWYFLGGDALVFVGLRVGVFYTFG